MLLQKVTDQLISRGGSRTAATSKMDSFVIIVHGWKPLTINTECSILEVAAVLDPSLMYMLKVNSDHTKNVSFTYI